MAVYLTREMERWLADMEKRLKNMSEPEDLKKVRGDIAKLRKDVKGVKAHLDKAAQKIMEALVTKEG